MYIPSPDHINIFSIVGNSISRMDLAATAVFNLTVHQNKAVVDRIFRLNTIFHNACQLQCLAKLINSSLILISNFFSSQNNRQTFRICPAMNYRRQKNLYFVHMGEFLTTSFGFSQKGGSFKIPPASYISSYILLAKFLYVRGSRTSTAGHAVFTHMHSICCFVCALYFANTISPDSG